jgi:CRISPR-associated protein Csd2
MTRAARGGNHTAGGSTLMPALPPYADPMKRMEFMLLFDVANGNPNGDPDAGNRPRTNATGHGLVTDVALKHKLRNHVEIVTGKTIYVTSSGRDDEEQARVNSVVAAARSREARIRALYREYWDNRMIGMAVDPGTGSDRHTTESTPGPLSISFATSVDPVTIVDATITRIARTTDVRLETGDNEMGQHSFIPYALYVAHGRFSPVDALKSGATGDDMVVLFDALTNLFEFDRSSARPEMSVRGLYLFTHDTARGCAAPHTLFERISITRRAGTQEARAFIDYQITIDTHDIPKGVTLHALVDDAHAA